MKWVTMWGNAQSTVLPMPARYAKDLTLRYPIFVPFDGEKIRITLDNYCVNEDVKIDLVTIGKGKSLSDMQDNDIKYLTFSGKKEVTIKAHDNVMSDELDINLKSDEYLIVSLYINFNIGEK